MTPSQPTLIVCSENHHLTNGLRETAKNMGLHPVSIYRSKEECLESLHEQPDAMLIVDWDVGPAQATPVLQSLQDPLRPISRPILLLTSEPHEQVLGVALEYGVCRVESGAISKERLLKALRNFLREAQNNQEVGHQLASVLKARLNGEWAAARNLLEGLKQQHPNNVRVMAALAENMILEGEISQALTFLQNALEDKPDDVRLLNLYGRCLFKTRKYEEAAQILESAKVMNPFNVERLLTIGHALLEIGRVEDAKGNFAQALAQDSANEEAQKGMGKALLISGEINEALRFLRHSTGTTECASIFNAAGVLCVHHGRFQQGVKLYEYAVRALEVHETILARLAFNLGLAYCKNEDFTIAMYYFSLASHLDETYEKPKRNIGILHHKVTATPVIPSGGNVVERFFPDHFYPQSDTAVESEEAQMESDMI